MLIPIVQVVGKPRTVNNCNLNIKVKNVSGLVVPITKVNMRRKLKRESQQFIDSIHNSKYMHDYLACI